MSSKQDCCWTSQGGTDLENQKNGLTQSSFEIAPSTTSDTQTQNSLAVSGSDAEKAGEHGSEQTQFDLEEILQRYEQARCEAGAKSKTLTVLWEDLTVKGIGGISVPIQTVPDTFLGFFNIWALVKGWLKLGTTPPQVDILRGFSGIAKPGEMVLVLGRPGAGCSTFLKVIANQRESFTGVEGNVRYGSFEADEMKKSFPGEAVYNPEEDEHHATLTVEQTLGTALDLKTPCKRPLGMTRKQYKQRFLSLLLKMLKIEHTHNTVVGNASVRGISGGERKRVSIAEMMITSATVLSWDNTTRGLDAATALDLVRSLRTMSNVYQSTTFVSLYQASDNIYDQFDKVLVADQGRQIYYGSTKEARAYFENLGFKPKPRASTPDFLTGCTDPKGREFGKMTLGRIDAYSPDGLREAWLSSTGYQNIRDEIVEYKIGCKGTEEEQRNNFAAAYRDSLSEHSPSSSIYTSPFYLQVFTLIRRQYLIKWQDKFSIVTDWATSILVAIVLGTVWLDLPRTSAGAFTRGGLLFISLLFNAFQAFGEVASSIVGRDIIQKHKAYTFYRPSALWLAQVVVDLTFSACKILVFSIIVYFMCGLVRQTGAFLIFYLAMVCGYMAMSLFFRTVGCLCPDFDYAFKFLTLLTTIFISTAGYMIQWNREQAWVRWLFYVNGLGLSFSVLMMNEFQRFDMICTMDSMVPSGPEYIDPAYRVCTLAGSSVGSDKVSGQAYLADAFSYYEGDLWRNIGIVLALIISFVAFNLVFGERISFIDGGMSIKCFQGENAERRQLNAILKERKLAQAQAVDSTEFALGLPKSLNSILTWEDLSYDVSTSRRKRKTRRLLHNIYGFVKPGQLVALMGASGAGKTTLLDILSRRKSVGWISGKVLLDACPPGIAYQRQTGYSEQFDVHEMTATVREALRFAADLRQPASTLQSDRYAYVEEVISLLEMEDVADAMIGTGSFGLSIEQRKRLTIGVELAAKPELLLFLDEPTTGLDSQSALTIISFLKRLAKAGQAIICTIHQPNELVFESFDRLLLLEKGGRTAYFGDIGHNAEIMLHYFKVNGAECPARASPAEWMLDLIAAGNGTQQVSRSWGKIWLDSPEFARVKEEITSLQQGHGSCSAQNPRVPREYATSIWHQIKVVNRRTQLSYWRMPNYGFTRWFNHVVPALLIGLVFFQLDESVTSLQYRIFVVFQATVLPSFILGQVQFKYDFARTIFYRESASRMYSQIPFALTLVLAEIPYTIVSVVCFFLLVYYIPGLQSAPGRAGYQFFALLVVDFFSVTLGQVLAAITPSFQISVLINPVLIIVFSLLCGVTVPAPQIPGFWRDWLYQLNPFTRFIQGAVTTELHGLPVVCQADELKGFSAPGNLTCGEYMHEFFSTGGAGYLLDNMTSACEYCTFKVGDQLYEPLGLTFETRWRDLGVLVAFCGANLLMLALACRYLNFNKR